MNDYRMIRVEVYREDTDDFWDLYEVQKFSNDTLQWLPVHQTHHGRSAKEYMRQAVLKDIKNG